MREIEELIKFYMMKYDAPYEVAEEWAVQDYHYGLVGPDNPEYYDDLIC